MGADRGLGPNSLTDEQLDQVQGDVWSEGFSKDYETYYLFQIVPQKRKDFAQSLKKLFEQKPPLISTLRAVKGHRQEIRAHVVARKEARATGTLDAAAATDPLPITNALIAFTYKGLETLQGGLSPDPLGLLSIKSTDRVFKEGMSNDWDSKDRLKLNDPPKETWDPLFKDPTKIHGLLKIAGKEKALVEAHLTAIKTALLFGTAIQDVPGNSPPTLAESRVDGSVRFGYRGKEHFGFEDGISQPLMEGIDDPQKLASNPKALMKTSPSLLIVSDHTWVEAGTRPTWMHNGSFLVFRKLQQNVRGFEELLDKTWQKLGCESKDQMGAKMMGRYRSGAPVALPAYHQKDVEDVTTIKENNFDFPDEACPFAAHIRKSHLRLPGLDSQFRDTRAHRTKIIRAGIPYGTEYKGNENDDARGLLFACYQSHIEDGFLNIQANWSNVRDFLEGKVGHDPIIGQDMDDDRNVQKLRTTITNTALERKAIPPFDQLVTLRGGEYFFVPSVYALTEILPEV